MHGEAIKAHKPVRGKVATGSHQVLPGGLARKCPVDSFAEAAISKEDLSAEGNSRAGEWASLGVLSERMWEKLPGHGSTPVFILCRAATAP